MDQVKNFVLVTLSSGITNVATSMTLNPGQGAKCPTPPFNMPIWDSTSYTDPSLDPNVEIVRVTAIATDTLTITRAQEGTSASAHNTSGHTYMALAGITQKNWQDMASGQGDGASDTGSANAYASSPAVYPTSLSPYMQCSLKAANNNTGASTLNAGGTGAIAIRKFGSIALNGGEIIAGNTYTFMYDGIFWQILNPTPVQAEIWLTAGNGHGSTNTDIRRYTNVVVNTGTAMTYADSATLGMSITINDPGIYSINVMDASTAADEHIGISKNATGSQLTTGIDSLAKPPSQGYNANFGASTNDETSFSVTIRCAAGDIIRAHDNGSMNSTGANVCQFRIIKVGD